MSKKFVLTTKLPPEDIVDIESLESENEMNSDLYVLSLAEDIQSLPGVRSVSRSGFVLVIDTDQSTELSELKAAMKPFFSGDRFSTLRFDSLEPG